MRTAYLFAYKSEHELVVAYQVKEDTFSSFNFILPKIFLKSVLEKFKDLGGTLKIVDNLEELDKPLPEDNLVLESITPKILEDWGLEGLFK